MPACTTSGSTPVPDPPAEVRKPAPFLRVPREIRDNIYRYLLSTKYTKHTLPDNGIKHNYVEPEMVSLTYLSNDLAMLQLIRPIGSLETLLHLSIPHVNSFDQPTSIS